MKAPVEIDATFRYFEVELVTFPVDDGQILIDVTSVRLRGD